MLWRLIEVESQEVSAAVYEIRKKFAGHVIGNSPDEQADGVLRMTEMLGQTIKLPIDQRKQQYVTIRETRSNMQAAALSDGQITVTLSRKMNRAAQEAPLIQEIHMQHNLQ